MLVCVEDREHQFDDLVQEVVQEVFVAFVHSDHCLAGGGDLTMRELEEMEVHWFFREALMQVLAVFLLHPTVGRIAW